MTARSNFRAWEDTQSIQFLRGSLEAFNEGDRTKGLCIFGSLNPSSSEHAHKIYKFLCIIKKKPLENPEYGRYAFHDINGLSSTVQEKAKAISQYLEAVSIYNEKIHGVNHTLQEPKLAAATQNESSWGKNLLTGLIVLGGMVTVSVITYKLFSALRNAGDIVPRLRPSLPGHIIVGGGHMDLPKNVVVGGGHLSNALKNIKESAIQLNSIDKNTFNGEFRIVNCTNEYPSLTELKESDNRFANDQLERIHRDYRDALWQETNHGIPVDHDKFKQEIEKLANKLGKEAWGALLHAIGESIGAGIVIECPRCRSLWSLSSV